MRYRTRTIRVPGTHVVDGIPAPVVRTEHVREPIPPRDWEQIATRVAVGIAVLLTLGSVGWSTVAIGHLLGGGLAAYTVAATFDLGWLGAFALAYIVRHRPDRRGHVNLFGWVLLAAGATAIVLEGLHTGSVAGAIIGGAISAVAKLLWSVLDRATRPALSPDDAQWVAAQLSQADATLAVAAARRRAARAQGRAADELLAMEAARRPALPPAARVDPTPLLDPGSAGRPGVDPDDESDPDPGEVDLARVRPALHAVGTDLDPELLDRARAAVADLRAAGTRPSRDRIKQALAVRTDVAGALWRAIQAEEADPSRRSA